MEMLIGSFVVVTGLFHLLEHIIAPVDGAVAPLQCGLRASCGLG
jgi:hypothetical protein